MISFVIPVYNGSKVLKENLKILTYYLDKNSIKDYELLLINDGSTDDTVKVFEGLPHKRIILISYSQNRGKGYALKYSSKFVKGEIVILMDLDIPSQADLKVIKEMIYYLKKEDIVIGSRYLNESTIKRKKIRLLLSKLYKYSITVLFPNLNISDTDFGLKAFKTSIFRELNNLIKDDRWSWDLEMLLLAKKEKKKIKEIPVSWQEKGATTFGVFKGPLRQLISTINIRFRYF